MVHFQQLASVNMEIQAHGTTAERLLRKSILEIDVGNFSAALDAALDAAELKPDWPEPHYQQGMALVLLAFCKAGVVPGSAGMERPLGSVKTLLEQAARALGQALRLHPGDEEVAEDVAALSQFLVTHGKEVDSAVKELGLDGLQSR